jgi:hypothetical protein
MEREVQVPAKDLVNKINTYPMVLWVCSSNNKDNTYLGLFTTNEKETFPETETYHWDMIELTIEEVFKRELTSAPGASVLEKLTNE